VGSGQTRGEPPMKELVNLQADLNARRISLVGKGRQLATIAHQLADMLREYLDKLRPNFPMSLHLFANPRGNRSLRGRYGPRALHNLVIEARTWAGLTGRHFAQRWRHNYATSLVRRGEDVHVVQRLMGHCNIVTTSRTCISRTRISSHHRPDIARKLRGSSDVAASYECPAIACGS